MSPGSQGLRAWWSFFCEIIVPCRKIGGSSQILYVNAVKEALKKLKVNIISEVLR
jgi:hypothetical protein